MRTALLMLLLGLPAALPAGDTYTWLDDNNERHWSDTPHEGAERVELPPSNGYRAPPPSAAARPSARPVPAASVPMQCSITQPANEQVLFEVDSVTISVSASANAGGSVSATLDGAVLEPTQPGGTSFVVTPVDRGTHVAAAVVRDGSGRTLCSAAPVTFYVRQHSVAKPH
jgi:hypothetical protein